jgi:cysteine synthase
MNTMTSSPTRSAAGALTGVRVVVTHDKEQAKDQTELFQALGAEVFYYPA